MPGEVIFGWKVEVDVAQLAARLESYLATRRTTMVFGICIQKALQQGKTALGRISPDISEMIYGQLQDQIYNKKIREWTLVRKCVLGTCTDKDHATRTLWKIRHDRDPRDGEWYDEDDMNWDSWHDDNARDDHSDKHATLVDNYLWKLKCETDTTKKTRVAKAKEVVFAEFGVKPFFTISEVCSRPTVFEDARFLSAKVRGYLTAPMCKGPVRSRAGIGKVTGVVEQDVDIGEVIDGLISDPIQPFRRAIVALRLEQPHKHIEMWEDDNIHIYRMDRYGTWIEDDDLSCEELEADLPEDGEDPAAEDVTFDTEGEAGSKDDNEGESESSNDPEENVSDLHSPESPSPFEPYCIDCGMSECRGERPKLEDPTFGLLGWLESWAYINAED